MKKYLFFLLLFSVCNLYSQIIITNPIDCEEQPYRLTKLESITISNSGLPNCNPSNYSEIISSKFINVQGTIPNIGSRFTGNIHFAIKAPYEDVYVRVDRELKNDFIIVITDLRVLYTEEYLDNVPLKYKVYKYKGEINSYACNNHIINVDRGENYITIPLDGLSPDLYTLEIEDQKGVLYFVRFKKF